MATVTEKYEACAKEIKMNMNEKLAAFTAEKYEACAKELTETMAQYEPAKTTLFGGKGASPEQCARYAAACGLAEATIVFAVLSEGDLPRMDAIRDQARDPRWVVEQGREVLAALFREEEGREDYGS